MKALHSCIRDQGYARTSLTDVGLAAKMSPSHVRYYFDGKEAILEHYFETHCRQIVADIRAIPTEDPDEWFRRYVNYYIANPHIRSVALGVIVEIFGLAVHHDRLRAIKTAYDCEMLDILAQFFESVGVAKATPRHAAATTLALEVGLKINAAFTENYDAEANRETFVTLIELLVGRRFEAQRNED